MGMGEGGGVREGIRRRGGEGRGGREIEGEEGRGRGREEGADKRERRESAQREVEGKSRVRIVKTCNDLLQGSLINVVCQWKVFATCTYSSDVTL